MRRELEEPGEGGPVTTHVQEPSGATGDRAWPQSSAAGDARALGVTLTAPEGSADGAGGADDQLAALPVVDRSHYQFAAVIAQGGMGKIFRATDRRLGRPVAIKELLGSHRELASRFAREIRITARLQHPAIVGLHEAGRWADGHPFFAMELVEGEPLDDVIARATTPAQRIALLPHALAVADALAYAHACRIIHRDLKPHNVLVGRFGETVVIDWGLAKELGDPPDEIASGADAPRAGHETRHGSVLGTPAYMPPEQAAAEVVDERADVYAIGALLYHLLAGHPPYQGASSADLLRQVLQTAATPIAVAAPEIPRELAAIVTTAMSREPTARYPTARELAEDLRRFQTGQLVGVHHYTTTTLLRRWLHKHRAVIGVATAALAAIVVVAGLGVARVVDERDAAHRAEQLAAAARIRADAQRSQAEAQRAASEALVGYMLGELQPQLERVGRLALLHGVAARIDGYYGQIDELPGGLDDAARSQRAGALHLLGVVLDSAGDVDGAQRAFTRAIELRAAPVAAGDLGAVLDQARTRNELAVTFVEQGDLDGAERVLTDARDALTARPARGATGDLLLATALRRLGAIATARGDLAGARATLERALEHADAATAASAGDRAGPLEATKIWDRLVDVRRAAGDNAGAQVAAEAGLAARRAMIAADPGALDVQAGLSVSWDKLYMLALSRADAAAATHAARAAVDVIAPLVARDPDNADWGRQLLVALLRTGDLAEGNGDGPGARRQIEAALAIAERLTRLQPGNVERLSDLSSILTRVGALQLAAGEVTAAIATQTRAVAVANEASRLAPDSEHLRRELGVAHEYLGDALLAHGEPARAADAYQVRVDLQRALLAADPDNPLLQRVLVNTQFLHGRAVAAIPARRAEGLAAMTSALADLRARQRDGELPREWASGLDDYQRQLRTAGGK